MDIVVLMTFVFVCALIWLMISVASVLASWICDIAYTTPASASVWFELCSMISIGLWTLSLFL